MHFNIMVFKGGDLTAEGQRARPETPTGGKMAERTGFEPATPGVTGRYSNQLNYRSTWWALLGSNQ